MICLAVNVEIVAVAHRHDLFVTDHTDPFAIGIQDHHFFDVLLQQVSGLSLPPRESGLQVATPTVIRSRTKIGFISPFGNHGEWDRTNPIPHGFQD